MFRARIVSPNPRQIQHRSFAQSLARANEFSARRGAFVAAPFTAPAFDCEYAFDFAFEFSFEFDLFHVARENQIQRQAGAGKARLPAGRGAATKRA
jgi:hypothetical protein